jgi:hypothetical protein
MALAGAAPGVAAERAVGSERLVLCGRGRRARAALRPDRDAERDRAARGRARDRGRADLSMARARHAEAGRAPRRARLHAATRHGGIPDRLDVGVEAFPGQKPNDVVLWIESHRVVIAGDTLVDFGHGLEINARWLQPQGVTREQVVSGLLPLLERPVEHVLATHGGPYDRAALERALSASS